MTPLANQQGKLNPLKHADPNVVLQRYLNEESTSQIAATFGVTRAALNLWLIENHDELWKQSQVVKAIARKESAEDEMDAAQDPLTLARARERLKAAQWDLERVCRRIYGDTPQNVVSSEQLADLLVAVSNRMLTERQVQALPHDASPQSSVQSQNSAQVIDNK